MCSKKSREITSWSERAELKTTMRLGMFVSKAQGRRFYVWAKFASPKKPIEQSAYLFFRGEKPRPFCS